MRVRTVLTGVVVALTALTLVGAPSSAASPVVWVSAHVQDTGWLDPVPDGEVAGTTGQARQLEALQFTDPSIIAQGHVQDIGWMPESSTRVGTTGKSLRLEAVRLSARTEGWKVTCQAHVQNIGWMPTVGDGQTCGTTGRALRLEAVRIWMTPTTPVDTPSATLTAVGDIGMEQAGMDNLQKIGSRGNPLLILGDLGYTGPAEQFCSALKARVKQSVMWVQGNHENRDADFDTAQTDDYVACMPSNTAATGETGIQQVYKLDGAWIITASPQEAEPGSYLTGGPRWTWVRDRIRDAKAADVWPILAFHEPHYTVGDHGPAGPESAALSKLAVDEGVRLVITAHDHIYARTQVAQTTFVVAGMGGHKQNIPVTRPNGWVACNGSRGFVTFSIYPDRIVGHVTDTCPDDWTITR
ncbi:MAG: metallophosphoesterase [Nocardiaceae bacterium]|nr:metallophosphoesterase [Nocardiaceae bacterium]